MTTQIRYSLAENALDHLLKAGEEAHEGSSRSFKFALANVCDGTEQLLKARLELHDWKQLFTNPAKADRRQFEQGDFFSINFRHVVDRLDSCCSVSIDPAALAAIDAARQLRNRIRHFAVSTDQATAVSLITKVFSFAVDFVAAEIESDPGNTLDDEVARLREMLGEFDGFVKVRMAAIAPDMASSPYGAFVKCPACLQPCLGADGGEAACKFCGYRRGGEVAAEDWELRFFGWLSPKDRLIANNIRQCPECGSGACIETDSSIGFFCFHCGEGGEYEACGGCGELSTHLHPGEYCDDCWTDLMRRND